MVKKTAIRDHAVLMLTMGFSASLTYHNNYHTLYVTLQRLSITTERSLPGKQILLKLQVAALSMILFFYILNYILRKKLCIGDQTMTVFWDDRKNKT